MSGKVIRTVGIVLAGFGSGALIIGTRSITVAAICLGAVLLGAIVAVVGEQIEKRESR